MDFSSVSHFNKRKSADLLIVPCKKGGEPTVCKDLARGPLAMGDFKGKEGECLLLYPNEGPEKRVLLVGLGETMEAQGLRRAYAAAVRHARKLRAESVNVSLPKTKDALSIVADGMLLANDPFDALKHDKVKEEPTHLIKKICFVGTSDHKATREILGVIEGVRLTRTLINGNADDVTAQKLASVARKLAKDPKVTTTVFSKQRMEKEGMGLALAVNRAAPHDPAFVIVRYEGNKSSKDHTVLVGKGVTYDTGGLSLKPTSGMLTMKADMSGAATVLGVIKAASTLKLKTNVTAVFATGENCIGPKSYKPGDVYQGYNGTTVEIVNTDAEGRLLLADGLAYAAKKLKPTRMIDLATLTGSIVVALGEEIAGLMTDDDALAKGLVRAGDQTGEGIWRMPLHKRYKKLLKSEVADIANCGVRWGSAITAGLFLKEFVGDVPWAHIDMAGTAYPDKATDLSPGRATGYGVRLLISFLKNLR